MIVLIKTRFTNYDNTTVVIFNPRPPISAVDGGRLTSRLTIAIIFF
jgi:hypothetical protein